jgi:hypothetical protein
MIHRSVDVNISVEAGDRTVPRHVSAFGANPAISRRSGPTQYLTLA